MILEQEMEKVIKKIAGDVIWSGYNAHNSNNKTEVLWNKKIKQLSNAIIERFWRGEYEK